MPALDPARRRDLRSVDGLFEPDGYRAATSDVGALLVFSHQTKMMNLLTRIGWEARLAAYARSNAADATPRQRDDAAARVREAASDLVDYMLFVDEAPFAGAIRGSSGFAEKFSAQGPRDGKGRSLN